MASDDIHILQFRPDAKDFVVDVDVGQTDLHKYTYTLTRTIDAGDNYGFD